MILDKPILSQVYTASEAAEKWNIPYSRINKWIFRRMFREEECRKSKGTFLVTHEAMVRMTGEESNSN